MIQPAFGMKVRDVQDRPVGVVTEVSACCIEIADLLNIGDLCLSHDGIFTVADEVVTLICDRDQVARYRCGHGLG